MRSFGDRPSHLAVVARSVAVGIACLFVVSSCTGGGESAPASEATGSAVPNPSTSSTLPISPNVAPTVPAGPTTLVAVSTTMPGRGLETVEAANQNLWDSWRDDDRIRAELYASREAVETLFLTRWGPENRNQGCAVSSVRTRCLFTLKDGARLVVADGSETTGYRVVEVQVIGKLPTPNRLQSDVVDTAPVGALDSVPDVAPTIEPSVSVPLDAGGSTGGSGTRRTTRRRPTTRATNSVTAGNNAGDATSTPVPANNPAAEPAPAPPAPGPVQAGQTVDTVASG